VCKNGPKGAHRRTKAKKSDNFPRPLERQDYILGHVITGDETWVYQYDLEMNGQSAQWKTANSPQPKKILSVQIKSQNNVAAFF